MKKGFLKGFLVLAAVAITYVPAFATNWVNIGPNHYIDSDSIKPSTNYGTYTMKTKYVSPTGPLEVINGRNVYTIRTNSFVDCTSNYAKTISYTAYDRNGSTIASGRNVGKHWYDIDHPGSRAYETYAFVCTDKYINSWRGHNALWWY